MPALSWLRLARRSKNLVRQKEHHNLEKLLDEEAARQPTYTLFVLSCAIPAGIGTFGMGSVFVAWISGNTGLPLILGTAATAILAGAAWFTFYRLYTSIPPSKKKLRDLILKFSKNTPVSETSSLAKIKSPKPTQTSSMKPPLSTSSTLRPMSTPLKTSSKP